MGYNNIIVPEKAIDGPNIMYHADFVVGGGGSMNREAAVLGAKTYSLYAGKLSAVDRYLMDQGRMIHVSSFDDIKKINVCKRKQPRKRINRQELIKKVANYFMD